MIKAGNVSKVGNNSLVMISSLLKDFVRYILSSLLFKFNREHL